MAAEKQVLFPIVTSRYQRFSACLLAEPLGSFQQGSFRWLVPSRLASMTWLLHSDQDWVWPFAILPGRLGQDSVHLCGIEGSGGRRLQVPHRSEVQHERSGRLVVR